MWAWEMGEEVEVEDAREWVGVEVGSGERFMMGNVVEEVLLVGVEERLDVVVAMFAGKERKILHQRTKAMWEDWKIGVP